MTEENSPIVPIITIFLASIILFAFIDCLTEMSSYERLSIVVLTTTALIIAWYTIETYHLRLIQARQIDISILPSIVVFRTEEKDSFTIRNVGNGVAVNIKFDDTVLNSELNVRLRFPEVLSLAPNESELIKIDSIRNGHKIDFPFAAHLDKRYANRQWEITVTFEDIARQKYRQALMLGINGPYLGKYEKVSEPV